MLGFTPRGRVRTTIHPQALSLLESYGQQPLVVCTVCGPYRTGKSFLLNLLLGRIQHGQGQFRVGAARSAALMND